MIVKIVFLLALLAGIFLFFRVKDKKSVEKKADDKLYAVDMKQDSICGAFVEETTKYKVKLHDKIYYFCSEECKNKFIEQNTNP